MAEAKLEKAVCVNCGADVRPDTQFCYNCGKSVTAPKEEVNESLADLEKALAASRLDEVDKKTKLETAAAERRRARVSQRKTVEIVWEPSQPRANVLYFIFAAVIFVAAVLIVLLLVFWK